MTERRFLLRGVAAGAGAMLVAVIFALMFVLAFAGDPGPGWADRHAVTGVLLTALWCAAAGGAGAVARGRPPRVARPITRRHGSRARSGRRRSSSWSASPRSVATAHRRRWW